MKQISKQNVGIDISKDNFETRICFVSTEQELSFSRSMKFENNKKGFKDFVKWSVGHTNSSIPLHFTMEATGVYYESLAYYLVEAGLNTHVLLPNTSKHFFGSLNAKSKTDKDDAKNLSQFGVERKFENWNPPPVFYKNLRSLTRYCDQLKEQKTDLLNMLHSYDTSVNTDEFVKKNLRQLIKTFEKQIEACSQKIQAHIKSDPVVEKQISKICTTKGLALVTVAIIVAETFGFHLFHNQKQLTSYAGYDVVERQSGSSIKGKTRISKKGNKRIRKALFFPAMTHIRHNEAAQERYNRIVENNGHKMVGQVAAQRKLLILIYTLWKNNEVFDEKKAAGIRQSRYEVPSVEYDSVP